MKVKLIAAAVGTLVLVGAVILIAGCSGRRAAFGDKIAPGAALTAIDEILTRPAAYVGTTVVVEGRITSECPAGGWFYLAGHAGTLYVDLHPMNLAIPQRVGKTVRAIGVVDTTEDQVRVVGSGVELR